MTEKNGQKRRRKYGDKMWKDDLDNKYNILPYISSSFESRASRELWRKVLGKVPWPILVIITLALLGIAGFLAWVIYYLTTEVF